MSRVRSPWDLGVGCWELSCLWFERGDVRGNREGVVLAQFLYGGLHERGVRPGAGALLEVIQRAADVARRAAGNRRDDDVLQHHAAHVGAVAGAALGGADERLPLLHAADRRI